MFDFKVGHQVATTTIVESAQPLSVPSIDIETLPSAAGRNLLQFVPCRSGWPSGFAVLRPEVPEQLKEKIQYHKPSASE